MKKILYNIHTALLFFIILLPLAAIAADGEVIKEKSISKVYLVNSNAGIDINNKYGNIYVTTWDENKISIDVIIKVHGKNEAVVTKRINGINIEINPLTSLVSAKTVFDQISGSSNISMEINYTIKIPKNGSVKLNDQYGSIKLDRILGKVDIDCKYGSVILGELMSNDNNINVQYCDNSTITYMKRGVIDAKYSQLKIDKSSTVTYKSDYTNLSLKDVANINYNSNYGDISIGNADNISGIGDYLTLKFGTINNNFNVSTDYSTIAVANITAKANNINISSTYTDINLKYDSDYTFEFEFNFRYSDLQASGLNFQTKKESGNTSYYKGYYKSNSSNKMTITSNYGDLKLTKI